MSVAVVTVAFDHEWPSLQALVRSLRGAGFEHDVQVVVADAAPDRRVRPLAGSIPVTVAVADDVVADPFARALAAVAEVEQWRTVVTANALAAALSRYDTAILLHPGIEVIAPLDDLLGRGDDGLIVIGRPAGPVPHDGRRPSYADLLRSSWCATSVFAVDRAATRTVASWAAVTTSEFVAGDPIGLETALTALAREVPTAVLAAARLVDWYTLAEPTISAGDLRATIVVDCSGFDPEWPERLDARGAGPVRTELSTAPALARIVEQRGTRFVEPPPIRLTDDVAFDATMRSLYVARVHAARDDGERLPPDPRRAPTEFVQWLRDSDYFGSNAVSRYLREVYIGRHDLVRAFPEVPGRDTTRYHQWCHDHGRTEVPIPASLLPEMIAAPATPRRAAPRFDGVNLVGFLDDALGIGEIARRIALALRAGGVPCDKIAVDRSRTALGTTGTPRYGVNIVCINPDSLLRFVHAAGEAFVRDTYTIGVWFWETESLPPAYAWAFDLVDEVWTASEFVAKAIRARAPAAKPVKVFTLPLIAPAVDASFDARDFGLSGDGVTFLASWDYLSVVDRKNPIGAVHAYTNAFPQRGHTQLVLKCTNASARPEAHERVRAATGHRPDIKIVDAQLESSTNAALLAKSSCFVSLHRSEGLGLNLADAMLLGVPVIATGYGGNLAFMDADNSLLVPFTMADVGPGQHPYPFDDRWAEPDLTAAAAALRAITDDLPSAKRRAEHAREQLEKTFNLQCAGASLATMLNQLGPEAPTRRRRWSRQ